MNKGSFTFQILYSNKRLFVGLILITVYLFLSIFGPFIFDLKPNKIDLRNKKTAPFKTVLGQYPLGTDGMGRDVFSRLVRGAQISLTVGIISTTFAALIGVFLGMCAGYYGKFIGNTIMRITDLIMCYPFIITSVIAAAMLKPGIVTIITVFSLFGWTEYCRVINGVTLSLKEQEYVTASLALGASNGWVIIKHIFPNCFSSVIVMATLQIRLMILGEATLSFIGIGIQPPTPSWGVMISSGREYLGTAWWISTLPGIALMLIILGFNLFGDGLNDHLNPKIQK